MTKRTERGASAVEYALLMAGIVTVILAWYGPLGHVILGELDPACEYISGGTPCEIGG